MNAFGQNLDLEDAGRHTAQAGGQPELIVIARAAIQTNHQTHIPHTGAQGVDVGQ